MLLQKNTNKMDDLIFLNISFRKLFQVLTTQHSL